MARNHTLLAVAAAVLFLLTAASSASNAPASAPTMTTPTTSAPAPAPTLDCTTYFLNLSDCLTYVAQGSNLTKPDKLCCPELAGLVDSNPICLCSLLGQAATYGVDVNRALKLPSACGVSTPPLNLCSLVGVPVASEGPAGAPSTVPLTPSPAGSGTTSIAQAPSPTESSKEKSGASSTSSSIIMGQILGLVLSACIGLFLF